MSIVPRAPHRESVLELALKRGKALVLTAELSDPFRHGRHGLFLAHDRRELEAAGNEHGGVAVVATAFVDEDTLGSSRGGALHALEHHDKVVWVGARGWPGELDQFRNRRRSELGFHGYPIAIVPIHRENVDVGILQAVEQLVAELRFGSICKEPSECREEQRTRVVLTRPSESRRFSKKLCRGLHIAGQDAEQAALSRGLSRVTLGRCYDALSQR